VDDLLRLLSEGLIGVSCLLVVLRDFERLEIAVTPVESRSPD